MVLNPTSPTTRAGDTTSARQSRFAVLAAVAGNVFEWYDFTTYGLLALPIARAFFPGRSQLESILLAVGTFGVGFLMRPVGAVVLGLYADRAGRKKALTLIILLMTIGTALIAFVPSYSQIGLAAPMLIVTARLLQGFSVGGDLGSATAFLIESAPPKSRGFYAGWQASSQYGGSLLGAMAGAGVTNALSEGQLYDWGWRIPFVLGLAIGPIGYYIRAHAAEPTEYLESSAESRKPSLSEIWNEHRMGVLQTFGVTILYTIGTYTLLLYMPTYAAQHLGIPLSVSFVATALAHVILVTVCPIAGRLADRYGTRPLMLVAASLLLVLAYPFFALVTQHPTASVLVLGQVFMAAILGLLAGPTVGYMGALFPARVRATGLSLGYNLAVPIFGGFGAFTLTWLIASTKDRAAPAYYLIFGAAACLLTLYLGRKQKTPGGPYP